MRPKTMLLIGVLAILSALSAAAHVPPAPSTSCDPASELHDFISMGAASATTGATGEQARGGQRSTTARLDAGPRRFARQATSCT
ncbi:MAG TPA: hypothetical protein VHH36_08965 [Candidatus Thermoplasmatota archaeon]|nr:hypothetical protein [Candidatus Thermoplasmatota archaeon]